MDSGNLALAKKMAQSIVKDGMIRDMDLFNDISSVLKQATNDPEAKSLLNRITLIRLSSISQNKAVTPLPAPTQNAAPVEEKVSSQVQPKNNPTVQAKNPSVQNQVAAPVQPKAAPPVWPKFSPQKQNTAVSAAPDEKISGGIPVGLWVLSIILILPGGIIASMLAKKKNPAKSGSLLIVGILTTIIAAIVIFVTVKYKI